MTPAMILAIIQLVTALTPEALSLVNHLIGAAKGGENPEDLMKKITDLVDNLQPMRPKL